MVYEIKKGEEDDYFDEPTVNAFYEAISREISGLGKLDKPCVMGGFAVHDVPLKKGGFTNLWLAYNGRLTPLGLDVGIHECIIFDEDMPDLILDKMNNLKNAFKKEEGI